MRILMPLPTRDFDPTESAVSWSVLSKAGHKVSFATPKGQVAKADPIMVTGAGLGLLKLVLPANRVALKAYGEMVSDPEFLSPKAWKDVSQDDFDALVLPGGHAQGMKDFLESKVLQRLVAAFFAADKPVAAICHGVVLAARSKRADGKSVLHDRKTTALLERQELLAWKLTRRTMGDYYRTYPETVEAEVTSVLASPKHFLSGPTPMLRDSPTSDIFGFAVRDGNYVSARWPGDTHKFANTFLKVLAEQKDRT